ncbi:MAG TPA: hypothetical protein VKJ45_07450, partial [Blastocatellia bacterium]|nr:hypothetical protein [Blastocatellia bacterium]
MADGILTVEGSATHAVGAGYTPVETGWDRCHRGRSVWRPVANPLSDNTARTATGVAIFGSLVSRVRAGVIRSGPVQIDDYPLRPTFLSIYIH